MYFSTVLGEMISAMLYCKNKFIEFQCVNQTSSLNFKHYNVFFSHYATIRAKVLESMGMYKYTYIYICIYLVGIYGKYKRCSKADDY